MKIMSRDFTTREKIMLLVLTLILLAAGYYAVIDQPIRTAINEAKCQQDELNTELMLLQTKAASLSRMQSEQLLLDYRPTMLYVEHDAAFVRRAATGTLAL